VNGLTLILKNIGQCDLECNMTLPIKTIMSPLKVSTYIITSITHCTIRMAVTQLVMFVLTFITLFIYIFITADHSLTLYYMILSNIENS